MLSTTPTHFRYGLAVLLLCIAVPFGYRFGVQLTRTHALDFPTFYFSARAALKAHVSPYSHHQTEGFATPTGDKYYVFPYLYPPPSLLALWPLTLLHYEQAKIALLWVNHLCILALLYLLGVKILQLDPRRDADAIFLLLIVLVMYSFFPVVVTLQHGQLNLLVITLVALGWYAQVRERWMLAGVALALAGLVKTYPLALLLPLLLERRFRGLAAAATLAVGFWIAAYLVLPHAAWQEWWHDVLPGAGYGRTPERLSPISGPWNQSVNGFAARLFVPNPFCDALLPSPLLAVAVPYGFAGAAVAVALAGLWRSSREWSGQAAAGQRVEILNHQFTMLLFLLFLIAPLSWEHHLVFVLPGIFVLLRDVYAPQTRGRTRFAVLLSAAILAWPFPIEYERLPGVPSILRSGILTLAVSTKFYGVCALWGISVARLWNLPGRRPSASSPPLTGAPA